MTRRRAAQGLKAAWSRVFRSVCGARITWPVTLGRRTDPGANDASSCRASDLRCDAVDAGRPSPVKISDETAVLPEAVTLQVRPLDAILRDGVTGPATIEQRVAYPREIVEIPPLRIGAEALGRVTVRENERHISWRETAYLSLSPAIYAVGNALVHGSAGLLGIGDAMVSETTWHTEPSRHRYQIGKAGITLDIDRVTVLSGTHLSLLMPGGHSYWHAVIDGAAKLAMIPDAVMETVDTVLFSADAMGQRELLALAGLPRAITLRPVGPTETLRVETLLLPWGLHGVFDYHPVINRFFDTVLANHPVDGRDRIERLYVDRRGGTQRRLVNEEAIVTALTALGFVAVRLEDLPVAAQINLFRQATIIVAPHGAGLTNIGFASPGCIVIELMMDAYVNWCFRRLAAIRKLAYDCVIGTAHRPWAELDPGFHRSVWEISVDDVVRTIERAVEAYPQNRESSGF